MKRLLAAPVVAMFAVAGVGLHAGASGADDQARADQAVSEFSERVVEAGFESNGPNELIGEDDEEFTMCVDEFDVLLGSDPGTVEGETARAASDEFEYRVESGSTTTELFSTDDQSENLVAVVITVDEEHRGAFDAFVEQLGAQETADCFRQIMLDLMTGAQGTDASTPGASAPEDEGFEVNVDVASDLGVGDSSSRLGFDLQADMLGSEVAFSADFLAAQVDRSLVIVVYGSTGDPVSGVDPEAELAATVESLTA